MAIGSMSGEQRSAEYAPLGPEDIRQNHVVFRFLNDKDRDILYLIFLLKKKQPAVSKILGRSQPSLVYDIRRIKERIRFIVYLREVFDLFVDFLETRMSKYPIETTQVLTLMYFTTSYTLTAKVLGQQQIFVRYVFERALKMLAADKQWDMYEIFSVIWKNKNKIRRVYSHRKPKKRKR